MSVTVTRTRQALGSQIREALDDLQAKGTIRSWGFAALDEHRQGYVVYVGDEHALPSIRVDAGRMMLWLNDFGYDVRFGRNS